MENTKVYLALLFDAPLQSWGYQSKFDRRTTASFPTRSGILGMICAAMGIDREDAISLSQFSDVTINVYTLNQKGRMVDYHTVGAAYDKKTQKQYIVPKANGGTGQTVVTYREYLQDATFGVFLSGAKNIIEEIEAALRYPKWGIWLGRKSCVPATPVVQGMYETAENALKVLLDRTDKQAELQKCEEANSFADGTDTLMDNPQNFATRSFAPRRIKVE